MSFTDKLITAGKAVAGAGLLVGGGYIIKKTFFDGDDDVGGSFTDSAEDALNEVDNATASVAD